MNKDRQIYDVAIIGGGLAGLALSIQSVKAGYKTVLFEKEKYPFHKVCGEYISLESWNFLEDLGLPLSQMDLPIIRRLLITAPNGKKLEHDLSLGGFGLSRFTLDAALGDIAKHNGVELREGVKVDDVNYQNEMFNIQCSMLNVRSKVAVGSFGKRSNLDVKWKRRFASQKPNKLNNYIGVKYHVRIDWPDDLIALHNFKNGYCGISGVEGKKNCLCYLTTAENLALSGNSIARMEQEILSQNDHLKEIFSSAEMLYRSPEIISQVSFAKKNQVEDHVLMIGDAAGMITPLCGNGMSMALHGSKIVFRHIDLFLQKKIPRWQMEIDYSNDWRQEFSRRLSTGRFIQRLFGHPVTTNLFLSALKPFPVIVSKLVRATHGQPF
jgi:flavin-dependent dehydrogenase